MPDPVPLPLHAYTPGQNARHPKGWFDAIKTGVADAQDVTQTQAWIAGRAYLDQGYFWECHEVLEAVWLALPNPSPERDVTQALIQLANARLKLRMDKPRACARLCAMVLDLLGAHEGVIMGLDVNNLRDQTRALNKEVKDLT